MWRLVTTGSQALGFSDEPRRVTADHRTGRRKIEQELLSLRQVTRARGSSLPKLLVRASPTCRRGLISAGSFGRSPL